MICTKLIVPHFVPHLWHLWHTYEICGTLGKIDCMKLRVRISKGINSSISNYARWFMNKNRIICWWVLTILKSVVCTTLYHSLSNSYPPPEEQAEEEHHHEVDKE